MAYSQIDRLYASMLGSHTAAPEGCAYACFGWADPDTGLVSNARTSSTQQLGFVLPQQGRWDHIYHWMGRRYIRGGMPVTLATRGEFWVRFMAGANFRDQVYANPLDGSALSGFVTGAEATAWYVATPAEAGALAAISTWSTFTP